MTISTTIVKNSYSGDGTTTTFSYTFKVLADSDLTVIIRSALGTETTKTLTTHYTITGVGSPSGGSITFTAGNIPSATETVVLLRDTTQTQAIDYIANDPFPAETHEEGLDRSVILAQELQEEVDRSIKISRTNTMTNTEFTVGAADRANKVLSFDSTGELNVAQELGTFKGNWSSGETFAVRDIVKDTTNNNIYICQTAHTSSGSLPLSSNADIGKWSLIVDAASATTSQNAAAASAAAALVSENNAATSETNAATSATNSATSATSSASSATSSANSATAAQTAQAAAEAALDNFDDRFLGAKASDPTLDNDGNALLDGALYFNTTDDVMKVYDLTNTTWRQIQLTTSDQANVNTVAADLSGSNTIGTVAGSIANVNTTATNIANINTTAGISSDVTSVASNSSAIVAVNNNETNINAVNANSANINLVAANDTNVTNVGTNIASITTAATNLADINAFANIYLGPSASAPTLDPDGSALDLGDLYFDTTTNTMKVYSATGWVNAGSSVNGTSARFTYTISGTPTTVSGVDDNGETLAYDAGFADVYVNGVRMSSSDITITSGTSVVFASALTNGDIVDIVAYGTFDVASIDGSNITSGTISNARLTGSGAITINGSAVALGGSVTIGETKPTISSISPDTITNAQTSITITGSNFASVPQVEFLNPSTGIWYVADTVTFNNSTSLTVQATLTVDAQYKIRIENPDGNSVLSATNILTVSDAPTWTTAAGDLGTIAGDFSGTVATVVATSDSAVTYSETTSVLTNAAQANCSLNSTTGVITTTDFGGASTTATTYNFTIRATDAEGQTADRSFSLTSSFGATGGAQFN
jgi:hypothetical protein